MMCDKSIVLVTGGSGLVGKAIAAELDKGHRLSRRYKFVFVASIDADLTNFEQTRALFELYRPNYVINLAAKVGGLFANMSDNESFYKINMAINQNVLQMASEYKVRKCLSCLSTCIFPENIEYPLDETKIHLGPPHSSNSGYSLAKRQVDILNKQYNSICGDATLFTAIIPTNVYGCHDNFNLEQAHVVPSLIHKAFIIAEEAKIKGSNEVYLNVCGTGEPLRQFIYAPDLARLILWTLESYTDVEPIIFSPDEDDEVSIGYVATSIANCFTERYKLKVGVKYDVEQSDGQYKKTASNQKLRGLYQDFKFTPFNVGVREVVDWFCSNYPNVRK